MMNAIVITYEGYKPSTSDIRSMVEQFMTSNCCDRVISVKHLDDDEIAKAVVMVATSECHENHSQYSLEFTFAGSVIDKVAIAQAFTAFAGIRLKDAKDAIDTGHIILSKELDSKTLNILFSNGLVLTKAPDRLMVESAIYVLNSMFRDNSGMFSLIKYLQEYDNGERTNIHHAVKAAVDVIYDHMNTIKPSTLNKGLYNMIKAWKHR